MADQKTNGARAVLAADIIRQWKADPEIRNRYPSISDYCDDRVKVFDLNLIRPYKPKPTPTPVPKNVVMFNPRKQL